MDGRMGLLAVPGLDIGRKVEEDRGQTASGFGSKGATWGCRHIPLAVPFGTRHPAASPCRRLPSDCPGY